MCRGVYIDYLKTNPPIFCCSLFSENYLNPQVKINKMVNKHTVDYHPSPSQLISSIHYLIYLWTLKGFIRSESSLNFFLNLYILLWLQKSFKFMVLRLLQINFWVKKLNLFIFTHAPKQNFPQVLIITPQSENNCPSPPNSVFWRYFFLRRKWEGEDYGFEKITKINKGISHKFW